MPTYGDTTAALIDQTFRLGADHVVVLMRHSARTFLPDIHDLENQLTPQGRDLSTRLGQRLPSGLTLRAYASPAQRCVETAELILSAYAAQGGRITRTRALEALGVFYALDQRRMWKGMSAAGGMQAYLQQWFASELPVDVMLSTTLAATLVTRVLRGRLDNPVAERQLDVCVLVREALLGQQASLAPVDFLDALVMYRQADQLWLASHHGPAQVIDDEIRLA